MTAILVILLVLLLLGFFPVGQARFPGSRNIIGILFTIVLIVLLVQLLA